MNSGPAIVYGTVDALGFAAGAALCIMMGFLQWRSPQITGGTRDLIVLWVCGGLWTTSCFITTMLLLGGAGEASVWVRVAMTAAWGSTCIGPLISLRAADAGLGGRLPAKRSLLTIGALAGLAVFGLFIGASLDPDDSFGLTDAGVLSFLTSLGFMALSVALYWMRRDGAATRRKRPPPGPLGRVVLGFWIIWIGLTVFNIVTPPSDAVIFVITGGLSQHWAIPVSILVAVSMAKTHYADVVLKRSLAILISIAGAAAIAWQIPGIPRGAPLVGVALVAAALMLGAPGLYRLLGLILDRLILKRPDYRVRAAAFGDAAGRAANPAELASITEQAIAQTLGLDAAIGPGGADSETLALAGGCTVALSPRVKARALMQAERTFLDALGSEYGRRRESLAFEAERREREMREALLKHAVTEADLKALRAQVDPHFLFNTLNAITDLISSDPGKAELMTERLAAFFRYTLNRQEQTTATLDEELDFVRQYLDIEKVRFGDRLTVQIEKADGLGEESVPSLILQPLVENALRHGLSSKREGGRIEVSAVRDGTAIRLEVADDGVGFTNKSKDRVGLTNVRERLKALHGEAARMTIGAGLDGKGASVVLWMPA